MKNWAFLINNTEYPCVKRVHSPIGDIVQDCFPMYRADTTAKGPENFPSRCIIITRHSTRYGDSKNTVRLGWTQAKLESAGLEDD